MKHIRTGLAVAALTLATWAQAQEGKLCVDKACLGMSLAEAEALKLEPVGDYGFKFKGKGDYYGLDSVGQRIVYAESGDFDAELIRQFRANVATICSFGGANARMTGSDGQRVVLLFSPTVKNGKAELALTEIGSYLPKKLNDADLQRIRDEAKAKYGEAFTAKWTRDITQPNVTLYQNRMVGNTLTLRLPEQDLSASLMAQPRCKPGDS
ncbi:hypothetical protein KW842_21835 [Duganella sp. sic0402]|uniref:hypothetical protein n=1 Tax=Duganella sp. sic0402 TaxID=2854786 RepID=UPI001C456262|nr:hypothetical protein [Duganella sp. sic0402]MBV7538420.1 hypothetical protein [Duganella sp. sic0402]